MTQVPDLWRTEVWHPLSVHFPIALLLFGAVAYLLSLFMKNEKQRTWSQFSRILIYVGVGTAWIGIYTGDLADGVVSRKVCDPTVLKDHEISAYTFSIIFSVAAVLLLAQRFSFFQGWQKFMNVLICGLLLTGSGFLVHTGHLGASVVYQQGGGVFHPSADCREFE